MVPVVPVVALVPILILIHLPAAKVPPPELGADKVITGLALATPQVAAAAEAAATWSPWLHGTGFVDHEVTAAEVGAMHALDGRLGFSIAAHFDKAEAF